MSTKQKEASKLTSKKIKSLKDEKTLKDTLKTVKPIFDKKEGMLKEISIMQLEDAMGDRNLSTKSLKKVVDAAADERQLRRTERKFLRDVVNGNGKKYGQTDLL
tara:strand:- start:42 stop:353 length:312 start_codon:yes stop_codon:yes gene_type:complete